MDLAVDDAGEDQQARGIDRLRRNRRFARAERPDDPVADREEAAREHPVGQHEIAADHEVVHAPYPWLSGTS